MTGDGVGFMLLRRYASLQTMPMISLIYPQNVPQVLMPPFPRFGEAFKFACRWIHVIMISLRSIITMSVPDYIGCQGRAHALACMKPSVGFIAIAATAPRRRRRKQHEGGRRSLSVALRRTCSSGPERIVDFPPDVADACFLPFMDDRARPYGDDFCQRRQQYN